MEYISKSENDTTKIAKKIFSDSSGGDIFALSGDLGSGKTTFTKAFAKCAGVKKEVTSPTFVLMKQYQIPKPADKKTKYLIHVDCYRMESEDDAYSVGLVEYFGRKDVMILIEWPEKISKIFPKNIKNIKFKYIDETTRKIIVKD